MWTSVLMSATLALITLPSAAHFLPVSRHTSLALAPINNTGPALEAPRKPANLTYSPWPQTPYYVPLRDRVMDQYLVIGMVRRFQTWPPIDPSAVRRFVLDFANNIEQDYPGFVPPFATQSTIDVASFTKWTIKLHEGFILGRLPTVVGLAALNELGGQVYTHGPARVIWGIKGMEEVVPWAYGDLEIQRLQGNILNISSSIENGGFRTA